MKIINALLTENDCYNSNRNIQIQGIMLHSVGCPQPSADVFVNLFNRPNYEVAVHAFIDGYTGDVYQTLPWNHRAWHCGGQANNTHIGIEMCEPPCITYTNGSNFVCSDYEKAKKIVETTYESAVNLFALLCKQYNLNPLTDIISHLEGSNLGVASNHSDPEHLWQGLNLNYSMSGFRKAVQERMNDTGPIYPIIQENSSEVNTDAYKVIVDTPVLNIRSGHSINYPVVGKVYALDVYTIVQTVGSWGKLKSGAGWICLDYCKKL